MVPSTVHISMCPICAGVCPLGLVWGPVAALLELVYLPGVLL
jgi:hypothetical protein